MKIGNITFKRRYSLIQILVDVFSAAALVYIVFIVYSCAQAIEYIKEQNVTNVSLEFLKWEPLAIWPAIGVVICVMSVIALMKPRKTPKKLYVNEESAARFCGIVDVGVSCVRLILLHALSEGCYLHMQIILQREPEFPIQLIIDAAIIALLIWFTHIRLEGASDSAKAQDEEKRSQRHFVED